MRENLREFNKKAAAAVKTAFFKTIKVIKNSAYILIPVIMLLSVGIIALTQETEPPFQEEENYDYMEENEENGSGQDFYSNYDPERIIPEWVKPARWFRSNAGGMPVEEMKSRIAALRGDYALVIDFTSPDEMPEFLLDFFDDSFFIETRALYKNGKEERVQWIFRDENYGVRLNAVLFEAAKDAETENIEEKPADDAAADILVNGEEIAVIQNTNGGTEAAEAQSGADENEVIAKPARKPDPASGFIEIYNEKYHLTTEYRYTEKGEKSKIEYFYKDNMKISAQAMLWDDEKEEYIQTHTDYYRYNRSSFLRAVERVFMMDQRITSADNVIADTVIADNNVAVNNGAVNSGDEENAVTGNAAMDNAVAGNAATDKGEDKIAVNSGAADKSAVEKNGVVNNGVINNGVINNGVINNVVKVTFPYNILAAANNKVLMSERYNAYPDFFGDLFVTKNSKLVFTTDDKGRVLEQTLISNDEERTVIWKIVNTWSNDRIEKITKTEGETVLLAEYVYNKNGERVLERNIKDGVLERVVRSEGNKDIEELYLNNKLVLRAVWEDGRKISESRVVKN